MNKPTALAQELWNYCNIVHDDGLSCVRRRFSVVEESEAVVSANLQRAARLRQSMMQKAVTGELA